ncbi:MAG TPA: enoyl-CoA hydratase/isomerase family protein [Pseudonocardiaceae bacterium]
MRQFSLSRPAAGFLRATFDRPPVNLLDGDTIGELADITEILDTDPELRVVVFDSVNPDFFMARYDLSATPPDPADPFAGLSAFADVSRRISDSPVISIASIRGRARGGGNELALACDMRFASLENALLGQPEVPSGMLPSGGGIERLTALVGRARAIEIVVTGDDYDATTAQRYGWINRAVPDTELDAFVDRMARRIASFDRAAVAVAKRLVARRTTMAESDLAETIAALPTVAAATRQRRAQLRERAQRLGADFELRLGHHLGPDDAV